jgi:hypothetical protein
MSRSKTMNCKGTLRQVFICLSPRTPYPPPLTHCIRVYRIRIHTGNRGELNQREGVTREATDHKAELKIPTNMTECRQETGFLQSINSDKHRREAPITGQFF